MARHPSIQELSEEVLRHVDEEQRQQKTANAAPESGMRTKVGRELQKLAAHCRQEAERPVVVTLGDLKGFIDKCQRL